MVSSGAIATFPMQVSSVSGLSGSVAFACTGAPANTACTVNPAPAQLGATVPVTVTLQTGVVTTGLLRSKPLEQAQNRVLFCLFAVPLVLLPMGRRQRTSRSMLPRVLMALFAVCLLLTAGCGATRLIPIGGSGSGGGGAGSSANPTAAGRYAITVTGVSNGVSHSLQFSLTVQ